MPSACCLPTVGKIMLEQSGTGVIRRLIAELLHGNFDTIVSATLQLITIRIIEQAPVMLTARSGVAPADSFISSVGRVRNRRGITDCRHRLVIACTSRRSDGSLNGCRDN